MTDKQDEKLTAEELAEKILKHLADQTDIRELEGMTLDVVPFINQHTADLKKQIEIESTVSDGYWQELEALKLKLAEKDTEIEQLTKENINLVRSRFLDGYQAGEADRASLREIVIKNRKRAEEAEAKLAMVVARADSLVKASANDVIVRHPAIHLWNGLVSDLAATQPQAEAYKQRLREDVIRECIEAVTTNRERAMSEISSPAQACAVRAGFQSALSALQALIKQQGEG